ncbi:MAG: hypothetical protein ABI988_08970 [Nitrospirota bacterium]
MNWTTEFPRTSGYYWGRESRSQEPYIVEVDIERRTVSSLGIDESPSLYEMEGEWYGPLKQPALTSRRWI